LKLDEKQQISTATNLYNITKMVMLSMQDLNLKWMTDSILKAWLILFEETLKSKEVNS
jgi:hypothetical protein